MNSIRYGYGRVVHFIESLPERCCAQRRAEASRDWQDADQDDPTWPSFYRASALALHHHQRVAALPPVHVAVLPLMAQLIHALIVLPPALVTLRCYM